MKLIICYTCLLFSALNNFSQKKILSENSINEWESLGAYGFSEDNNILYYQVRSNNHSFFVIKDLSRGKEWALSNAVELKLLKKYSSVIYRTALDSVFTFDYSSGKVTFMRLGSEVSTFKEDYLFIRSKSLYIYDLKKKSIDSIANVKQVIWPSEKKGFNPLFHIDSLTHESIVSFSNENRKNRTIVKSNNILNVYAKESAGRICIYLEKPTNSELWVFDQNKNVVKLINDTTHSLSKETNDLAMPFYVSNDGSKVIYTQRKKLISLGSSKDDKVKLLKYSDKYILGDKQSKLEKAMQRYYLYDIERDSTYDICSAESTVSLLGNFGRYFLIFSDPNDFWFNINQYYGSVCLYDSYTKKKKEILNVAKDTFYVAYLSPDSKFVLYYNHISHKWYSYDIAADRKREIATDIAEPLYSIRSESIGRITPYDLAAWVKGQNFVLLYDEFDIWKVFLDGSTKSVNITKGSGRLNNVKLRIVSDNIVDKSVMLDDILILNGFNPLTKQGGYFKVNLNKGDFHFDKGNLNSFSVTPRWTGGIVFNATGKITKTRHGFYVVERENSTTSNNLYLTKNLKDYKMVSSIRPELKYHWLNSKLFNYQLPDGDNAQGILYFPEDIDSSKRYPIIFNYYERKSDELHKFLIPNYSIHNIDIPLFVSQGYLVFVPDIISKSGKNGEGTFNSISSAIKALKDLSYIDTTRMGLQGHSYGGWQTIYMICHSNRFVAACEAAGVSDQVSAYGQLTFSNDRQKLYELGLQGSPYKRGNTPWTTPTSYIENSPIFNIGNIQTPLLMMHNKNDQFVPYAQGLELFLAMRRAQKPVWFLEYEDQGHQVSGEAAKDYHHRMIDFFSYYLKLGSEPLWMKP